MAIGSIPKKDSSGYYILKSYPFTDACNFRARFKGISGTATKNTSTNIDYLIDEERYINGVRLILKNHVDGDFIHFEVVDVDNILGYGAGVVLDRFGDNWYIDEDIKTQPDIIVQYPAKIAEGLYLRIVYTSIGLVNDVNIKANLYLHWKSA